MLNYVVVALMLMTSACGQTQSANVDVVKNVKVEEFKTNLESMENVQLVDVRTPGEWQSGIIEGAHLIDINGSSFKEDVAKLDRSVPVLVYCRSGGRSSSAASIMADMGFTQVYNLQGGITAWAGSGQATVKP
ncbi:MAG: rhodanese-like domain-containing protein [Flavobacteriales bacterium]